METKKDKPAKDKIKAKAKAVKDKVKAKVKAGASAASKGVLETLLSSSANKVLEMMQSKQTGTVEVQKTDGTTATVDCKDGQCSFR